MEVEGFVSKFHSLDGISLGEKRKNFFLLLRTIPSDQDALLASLVPKNLLENLFRLEILLKLQRVPELLEVLKQEEEHLPAKLLKNKWFCQKLAALLDDNSLNFVANVLPFTSFVIRRRLIAKLAIYGTKLDSLYDELCSTYGTQSALDLLVGCTASKIENVLKNQKVTLSSAQLILLHKKHPNLFPLYINQERYPCIDESVLNYIARHNIDYFFKLMEEFKNLGAHLGKRLTRKLLTTNNEFLMSNANRYSCFLHVKIVIKMLTREDLKKFFCKCLPPSFETLRFGGGSTGFYDMRRKLGRRYYEFLLECAQKVYKKNLYDLPDFVTEEMMETMVTSEREKWIEIKRKNGSPDDDLIKFMKINESIPLIKKKIDVTSSIDGRVNLIKLLLKTCQINNDLNALAEVGEYVSFRHRNDNETVLQNFLFELQNLFQLEKFEERHWKFIDAIISILSRQGDCSYFKFDFNLKYVEFLFRKKALTDQKIYDFLRSVKNWNSWDYKTSDEELRKVLLLKSIDLMPKLVTSDEKYADLKLISYILQWNKDHISDQMCVFGHLRLMQSFQKSVEDAINVDHYVRELSFLPNIFQNIICTKTKSTFRDDTIKNYFLMTFSYHNLNIDLWLLKHQPDTIAANFDKFLEHTLSSYHPDLSLLNYIKKYSFEEKTVNYCLAKLAKKESSDKLFIVLAVLTPASTFLKIIEPYYPSGNKIDENSTRKEAEIPIAIATSLKYTTSIIILPAIIKYCKGDFLRYSLESLYYRFYHSPENQLKGFLTDLSSKAVSVRKHSIFLTFIVGNVTDVRNLIQSFIKNERNVSVQKHLFTTVLKYFAKNPSDEFYEIVKICTQNLDENDSESFALLLNLRQIPEKYRARHVVFVWKVLKKSKDRLKLLCSLSPSEFKNFSLQFLLDVISEQFLKTSDSVINDFVVNCFKHTNYTSETMDAIFGIINQLKNKRKQSLIEKNSVGQLLSSFIRDLVLTLRNYEILYNFSQRWHTLFSATEAIREHLKLYLTLLFITHEKDLCKLSTAVSEFLNNLVSIYGSIVIDIFASELKQILTIFLHCYSEPNEGFFTFCSNLLKLNSLDCYLLVVRLLPKKRPEDESNKFFDEIVKCLRQVPQESVQMLMNLYVMEIE